jgi:hypothetical protein
MSEQLREALKHIVVNLDGENVDRNIFPAAALRIAREALEAEPEYEYRRVWSDGFTALSPGPPTSEFRSVGTWGERRVKAGEWERIA